MIEAHDELRKRIADKRIIVAQKEEGLKEQLKDIGSDLSPGKIIVGAVKSAFSEASGSNGLLKTGIGIGATVLTDRLLFKKAGFIVRALGMFVVRKLVNRISKKKDPQPIYD